MKIQHRSRGPIGRSRSFTSGSNSSHRAPQGRGFSGGRGGGKRKGFRGDYINESLYINKAQVVKEAAYIPRHTFTDFGLDEKILKNIAKKNYVNASPIQDEAIPLVMQGKDVIGVANTGTGKTAAFLLPLIHKIANARDQKILILAPTRELALQIDEAFRDFTIGMGLFSITCVGGSPMGRQVAELRRGVHVVVGTPGRVKDLINRGNIKPEQFGNIVLDEADRMLDMGFVNEMRYILAKTPKDRQSLFFSATLSPEIKLLCNDFLNNPITISVKTRDTAKNVDQDIVRVGHQKDKLDVLHEILNNPECSKVLIFREMKRSVDTLGKELKARGFKALALHGDMRNRERENAVKALASGAVQVVIATDVAARGIDIPDITHVINYDVPNTYDTYIHRIGRTGRGSSTGKALTFV
jgi:superfamily II DNA/RNA helicase